METYKYLLSLYQALITKDKNYDPHNYKWVLGSYIINDLITINRLLPLPYECITLFDIVVERDIVNSQRISLYEDITYKL